MSRQSETLATSRIVAAFAAVAITLLLASVPVSVVWFATVG